MKHTGRRYITVFIALSFSWLFIGSLVNFHRVHVYGKSLSLEWSFLKPKNDNSKNQSVIKDIEPGDPNNDLNSAVTASMSATDIIPANSAFSHGHSFVTHVKTEVSGSAPMRAPPFSC